MNPIELSQRFRRALVSESTSTVKQLLTTYKGIAQRLRGDIDALVSQIELLQAQGEAISVGKITRLKQYRYLLESVTDEMSKYSVVVENQTEYLIEQSRTYNRSCQKYQGIEFAACNSGSGRSGAPSPHHETNTEDQTSYDICSIYRRH